MEKDELIRMLGCAGGLETHVSEDTCSYFETPLVENEPAHDKIYIKTCVTSTGSRSSLSG